MNMDENNNNLGKKTRKMRRYRKNIKEDPERYEATKQKDRLRKQKEREQLRKVKQKDKAVAEELKRQKREQQRRFRAKQRAKNSKQKRESTNYRKTSSDLKEKLKACQNVNEKKKAVLRTQMWRMRIKMKDNNRTEKITSPFHSRTTEYRAIQKAK